MTVCSPLNRTRTAQVCKALGDETRLRVLELLSGGERCVCELQADLGIAQPLLSFHLKVLRDAELVADRRAGRWAHYSLRPEAVISLGDTIQALREKADVARETACCS
jgi:ArsR family transcriptional regulator, arsenate/arsenite/antimonite-responsive transcriptional repressor